MEIFFSREISSGRCILSGDEAAHCIRVLRHREGDLISVIDGDGTLLSCRIISASQQKVETEIISETPDWGSHPYRLHLAVSPTKNNDRYEWFLEKACEIGTDEISPTIGTHSERKIFKISRAEKILVSAAKQSLKGTVPHINEPVTVKEFISGHGISPGQKEDGVLRLIAYCFDEDGIHMERTPVYHLVASIAFLQAVELCRLNNIGIPPYAMTVLERSADFIYRIVKPDFTTPMLGDADRENLLTRRSDTSIYEGMNLSFFTDDLNEM